MGNMFFDQDGDLSLLKDKVVSVISFGNQGEAQAQNLRDSGIRVIIGTKRDTSFENAVALGFEVVDVPQAVQRANIHLLLVPDEIMPSVFETDILSHIQPEQAIVVSSGYNLYYEFLNYPANVDLLMIAPRMIGTGVRRGYLDGKGFPSMICVHQDATGSAQKVMLALCKAIGTLKMAAIQSSAEEETVCDLFHEHFSYIYILRRCYEILVEVGVSPEAAMLELWASGEEMELCQVYMTQGLFHQLKLHSQTSQYGQEVTGRLSPDEEEWERRRLRGIIARIKDGSFAKDWALEQLSGIPVWRRVHQENMGHPMISIEEQLLSKLGVLERETENK
jgi:ketol-acid reductoisomerase